MKLMTREEQIIEEAKEYYNVPHLQMRTGFIEGAKWADANPQFSKEEFIEKACKWLNKYASEYAFSIYDDDDTCGVSPDLVDDFKKAMEQL